MKTSSLAFFNYCIYFDLKKLQHITIVSHLNKKKLKLILLIVMLLVENK